MNIRTGEGVEAVQRSANGLFHVKTANAEYRSRAVVLAMGRAGTPRKLGVKGEELPHVLYRLIEADHYTGQNILVVGGGDSAVEAAMGLAHQAGNRVTLSYRRGEFSRIKDRNAKRIATPGPGAFLIRVDHQGGTYFIAAPQGNTPVAAKVEGVGIDADMMLIEATGSTLNVRERYLVRNSSSPPRTQFSQNGFVIVLPEGAVLEEASATRPGGLGRERILLRFHKKGITRSTSQASPTRERRKRSSKCSIA